MNPVQSLSTTANRFASSGTFDGAELRLSLVGEAGLQAAEAVARMLTHLHAEATNLCVQRVVVDFTELEFMSSACLKRFVAWIGHVRDLEPAAQYRIHLVASDTTPWQRRSMNALRCVAVRLVTLEG
ncbi:MAG TPA: hypothetical protein VJT73_16470 [Polyangiaceae bacterium]|nr:hypothetical protein [Polyangiaceae bacterium]